MSLVEIAFSIFLGIFTLTAIITLLGLLGLVKIPPDYLKKLFRVVIVEVAGIVIVFVGNQLKSVYLTEKMLTSSQAWDALYPEKSWRTTGRFLTRDGRIEFRAATYVVRPDTQIQIIEWESTEPIVLGALADEMTLKVSRRWTAGAGDVYPFLRYEVGKPETGELKLRTDIAMRGSWCPKGATAGWGFMLTRSWQ